PMVACEQWVHVAQGNPLLEQGQDDTGVLGVVLVPGVEDRLPIAGTRDGRHQTHIKSFLQQAKRQGAVAVSRGLHGDPDGLGNCTQEIDQALVIFLRTCHPETLVLAVRRLDQDRVVPLSDIDRHPRGGRRSIRAGSHRRQAPVVCENPQDDLGGGGCPQKKHASRCTTARSSWAKPSPSGPRTKAWRSSTSSLVSRTRTPTSSGSTARSGKRCSTSTCSGASRTPAKPLGGGCSSTTSNAPTIPSAI